MSAFIEYYKKNDLLHEDVMMKFLTMSLKGFAQMWYESLGKGMFTSFEEFLGALCASWDSDSKSWLPLIQEIEKLYVARKLLEEDLMTDLSVSSQEENSNEESHLIEDDKVMVDMKEDTSNHSDKKDDDTPCSSITNQETTEGCARGYYMGDDDIQEPTLPPSSR
jgi:hypothetical protein